MPRPIVPLLRRVLPWLVAAGLLWWVFSQVPLATFVDALAEADYHWMLPAMVGTMLCIYLADCLAISLIFTWYIGPVSFAEALQIRGASYLASMVNYGLGQGALAVFLKRNKGVPLTEGGGMVLLIMGINLAAFILISAGVVFGNDDPRVVGLRPYVAVLAGGLAVYLLLLVLRPPWLTRFAIFAPAFRVGPLGHLRLLAVRSPHLTLVFVAHYLTLRGFGVHPPLMTFLAFIPVLSLISALPISPQGLGTAQIAAVAFFAPYAQGSLVEREGQVLAASLSVTVFSTLFMTTVGLLWLRRGVSMLGLTAAEDDGGESSNGPTS